MPPCIPLISYINLEDDLLSSSRILYPGRFTPVSLVSERWLLSLLCCRRMMMMMLLLLLFRRQSINLFSGLHQATAILLLQSRSNLVEGKQCGSLVDVRVRLHNVSVLGEWVE